MSVISKQENYCSIQKILKDLRIEEWEVIQYSFENSIQGYGNLGSPRRARITLEIFEGVKAVEKEKRYAKYLKLKEEFEPDEQS